MKDVYKIWNKTTITYYHPIYAAFWCKFEDFYLFQMADAYIARHASALCIFILGKIIKAFKCKKRNVDILALFRKAKFVKTSEISVQVTLYIRWHVVCTITLKHLFR